MELDEKTQTTIKACVKAIRENPDGVYMLLQTMYLMIGPECRGKGVNHMCDVCKAMAVTATLLGSCIADKLDGQINVVVIPMDRGGTNYGN